MWKLSCIFLLLIAIGNCSGYDIADTAATETSRRDRNHENRKNRSNVKNVDYVNDERTYDDDYTREDSEDFHEGKLIGKWTNNGAAFEPKWRDGDSVPLVPFDDAKQTKVGRHETNESSDHRESSHEATKSHTQDPNVEQIINDESIDDKKSTIEHNHQLPSNIYKKNRYSLDNNHENPYNDELDNSRIFVNKFSPRFEKTRPMKIITDDLTYETKMESDGTKSHDVDEALQVGPNEYELNDDEYQKPRPRKRRPPENYEFTETRSPTFSITWSTETYVESTPSPDRPSWAKFPIQSNNRRRPEKTYHSSRRNKISERQRNSETAELKSLLKMQQIEGLSLSEILQRRNLTLADLLNGKPEVIDVLRASESREDDVDDRTNIETKHLETKKLFHESSLRKIERANLTGSISDNSDTGNEVFATSIVKNEATTNKSVGDDDSDEETSERLNSSDTENVRRKSNDEDKLSAIVGPTKPIILSRFDYRNSKLIDATTKPIAKHNNPLPRRNNTIVKNIKTTTNFDDDEIMEFSDFTENKNGRTMKITMIDETTTRNNVEQGYDDNHEDSGSTLSIENILGTTEQNFVVSKSLSSENDGFHDKVDKIEIERMNNTDVYRMDSEYRSDEPPIAEETSAELLPMTDDEKFTTDNENWKNHQIFSTTEKPYDIVVSEIEPEARAEIFELFSSGSSGERLENLLKSRNMSIDELVALRQRGSSKVHMAEVLRSREPSASRSFKQRFNNDALEFERMKINAKTMINDSSIATTNDLSNVEIDTTSSEIIANPLTVNSPNIVSVKTERTISSLTTEETNIYSVKSERTEESTTKIGKIGKHVELMELLTAFDSLPFSIRPDLDRMNDDGTNTTIVGKEGKISDDFVEKTKRPDLPTSLVEVGFVEEIVKDNAIPFEDSTEINQRTDYSSDGDRKNLSKVKPSIIASGAILGVTIVVFLAIFIVCRIRQKQKYTYRNTFSRAVFQGPVTTARKLSNSSSLNTIMVNVVATSTTKRPQRHEQHAIDDEFDFKSDIENDSLDANDSWDTIPDFMK